MSGPVLDSGLQPERTRLSWSRTTLAVAANAALLTHHGFTSDSWWDFVPAVLVACCAAAFAACGVLRYRQVHRAVAAGRAVTGHRTAAVTGALAVLPGLIVLVSVLLPHGG